MKIRWYVDPSHAWLEVELEELHRLGIAHKISAYSYVKEQYAYLEEDIDAGIYLKAIGYENEPISTRIFKTDCIVRSYTRYNASRQVHIKMWGVA